MIILLVLAAVVLIIASLNDIKTREVPDWLNYSLIASALGIRLIYSTYLMNFSYFLYGIEGFIFYYIIAYAMFYTGQWGGGDSKLLMGLGVVFGLDIFDLSTFSMLLMFLLNSLIFGAIYGFIYSMYKAILGYKEFSKEFVKRMKSSKKERIGAYILSSLLIVAAIMLPDYRSLIALLVFMIILLLYLWIFIRSVESVFMVKLLLPKVLTEGDWIVDDIVLNKKVFIKKRKLSRKDIERLPKFKFGMKVDKDIKVANKIVKKGTSIEHMMGFPYALKVNTRRGIKTADKLRIGDELLEDLKVGEYICGPSDLGIDRIQIAKLKELYKKKKIGKIKVKEGIPFVPSFFFGYVATIFYENWLLLLLS